MIQEYCHLRMRDVDGRRLTCRYSSRINRIIKMLYGSNTVRYPLELYPESRKYPSHSQFITLRVTEFRTSLYNRNYQRPRCPSYNVIHPHWIITFVKNTRSHLIGWVPYHGIGGSDPR